MMNSEDRLSRRTVLRSTAVAVAGVGLAGCSGGDSGNEETTEDENGDGGGDDGNGGGDTPDFDGFFDETDNYDGVVDETGAEEVTVEVGTEANGGNFGFSPAAVRVSEGTTVVWEWTGEGGAHNVSHEDGEFESETIDEEGHTFSYTFDSTGTDRYVCTPHESLGMKGAVVVK